MPAPFLLPLTVPPAALHLGAVAALGPPTAAAAGYQGEDFGQQMAAFMVERDTLLLRTDASRTDWQRLANAWVERIPWDTLDLGQIATVISAGLTDVPAGVARASVRLDALAAALPATPPSADDLTGVRVAALRLRLARGRDAAAQSALLGALLANPILSRLARSPFAAEALDALFAVARSDVLRPHAAGLLGLLTQIDFQSAPAVIGRAGRVALLIPVAFAQVTDQETVRLFWLTALRQAQDGLPSTQAAAHREAEAAMRRLEADRPPAVAQASLAGTFLSPDTIPFLRDLLRLSVAAESQLQMTSQPIDSRPDSVFLPIRANLHTTTFSTHEGVAPETADGETLALRTFGGFALRDAAVTLRADDFGAGTTPKSVVARRLSLEAGSFRISTDQTKVGPDGGRVAGATVAMAFRGFRIAEIRVRQLDLSPAGPDPRALNVRTVLLYALGMRLLTLRGFRSSVAPPPKEAPATASGVDLGADGPPQPGKEEPQTAFSKPSLAAWLRIPSIGIEEGGITFGYSNAVKVRPRWTVDLALRTYAVRSPYVNLSFNYNLLGVTPSVDRFLDFNDLRENSLGSFYGRITNQDVTQDNSTLFRVKQIAGVEHVERQTYSQPNTSELDTINIPIGVRYERTDFRGGTFGARTSLALERIEAPTLSGVADDDRASLALIIGPPTTRISRGLNLTLRGEGTGYRSIKGGNPQPYSWYRGILGLSALLWPGVRLSGASITSGESGTTPYPYEQVTPGESMILRTDTTIGSVYLGLMNNYDWPSARFTRFQGIVSVSVGVFEPYLRYDQRGSAIGFGLFVKVEPYLNRFGKRRIERLDAVTQMPGGY